MVAVLRHAGAKLRQLKSATARRCDLGNELRSRRRISGADPHFGVLFWLQYVVKRKKQGWKTFELQTPLLEDHKWLKPTETCAASKDVHKTKTLTARAAEQQTFRL